MKCLKCGVDNKAGAVLCEACGEALPVSVVGVTPPQVAVVATPTGIEGRACALIEAGKVTSKEFEFSKDDFTFTVGRTDLDKGIIPDLDLTKFAEKVKVGTEIGYTVSRKQAEICRRMGRLYLKAVGGAKTLVKPLAEDWKEVKKDDEVELHVGVRFRFGGTEGYVIFEVV